MKTKLSGKGGSEGKKGRLKFEMGKDKKLKEYET